MRILYSILLYLAVPVVLLRLLWRGFRAPGYWQRWYQRFGFRLGQPLKQCIWVHAVSVGEVRAATPLIKQIRSRYPGCFLLVSTTTATGSAQVLQDDELGARHVYTPYDLPGSVRRFLDHFQPCVAIIIEAELWPNLFRACHQRHVPVMVVNARLSAKSAQRYQRVAGLTAETLRVVSLIAAQTEIEADRFRQLGAGREAVHVTGNIKFDLTLPASLQEQAASLRRDWGQARPVWIAASTHEGEDEIMLQAQALLRENFPHALLVLVPRHPERFSRVATLSRARGYPTVLRSQHSPCPADAAVFIGDSMGELCLFYAAADIAFVGGSLVPTGGHNILEPALLGKPVLFGTHMFNFAEASSLLLTADAAIQVSNAAMLAQTLGELFADAQRRHAAGDRARQVVEQNRGALDKTMRLLAAGIDSHCRTGE